MKLYIKSSCILILLALTLSFWACKSPTTTTEGVYCSTLVITADTSCLVFVDGDYQGTFQSGDARKVIICKGEHLVIAKSLDSTVILAKIIVSVGDSVSKVVDLQIAQNISIAQAVVSPAETDISASGTVDPAVQEKPAVAPKAPQEPVTPISGTFQDPRDGKVYKTIRIGNQTWLAENLAFKTTNGCWAYNNNDANIATYGYLYNWETAKTVSPAGWRLPSEGDWMQLINALGGFSSAGGKLKTTTLWNSPNTGATNSSGFAARPGGYYFTSKNGFYLMEDYGLWWTSTPIGELTSYYIHLVADNTYAFRSNGNKEDGMSIRCVR